MPNPVEGLLEVYEDMVEVLLVLLLKGGWGYLMSFPRVWNLRAVI